MYCPSRWAITSKGVVAMHLGMAGRAECCTLFSECEELYASDCALRANHRALSLAKIGKGPEQGELLECQTRFQIASNVNREQLWRLLARRIDLWGKGLRNQHTKDGYAHPSEFDAPAAKRLVSDNVSSTGHWSNCPVDLSLKVY